MRRRYDSSVEQWAPLTAGEVGERIAGTAGWLSGGVALDHWFGRSTRHHGDIDVSVTIEGWGELRARLEPELRGFRAEDGWLTPATAEPSANTWFADAHGRWRLQVNLEAGDLGYWRYRRDERLALPWPQAVLEVDGIRTGAPEAQLLWKSRSPEAKDLADWRLLVPALPPDRRLWLLSAVRLAHPESPVLAVDVLGDESVPERADY